MPHTTHSYWQPVSPAKQHHTSMHYDAVRPPQLHQQLKYDTPATPPHYHAGPSNHDDITLDPLSSPPFPFIELDKWCRQMGLGKNEQSGLERLHFRVGDDLSTLPEEDWKEAGLQRLEWARILKANRRFRASGRRRH